MTTSALSSRPTSPLNESINLTSTSSSNLAKSLFNISKCCPPLQMNYSTTNSILPKSGEGESGDNRASRDSLTTSDYLEHYDFNESYYYTPLSILLLNFFLVAFLMIIIGIAVYPAVRKYCSSNLPFSSRRSSSEINWIEDPDGEDDIVSASASTVNNPSFALISGIRDAVSLFDPSFPVSEETDRLTQIEVDVVE